MGVGEGGEKERWKMAMRRVKREVVKRFAFRNGVRYG